MDEGRLIPHAAAFLVWLASSLCCLTAFASPSRVLLLEPLGPRPALRDALRIQLARSAEIVVEPIADPAGTAARLRAARALLEARGARLALWIDEESVHGDEREAVVHFVAGGADRSLVDVVRVRAESAAELERAIAVKAVEVLEAIEGGKPDLGRAFVRAPRGDTRPARATSLRPTAELTLLGASGAGTASAQLGLQIGAGVAARSAGWAGDVIVAVRAATPLETSAPVGSLDAREAGLVGAVRARWVSGSFEVGGAATAGVRAIVVDGTTRGGNTGRADETVPIVALGTELRLLLSRGFHLRVAGGAEVALLRQRFTLNGEPVLDLGRSRALWELGVVGILP
jgi:hypothetical protein